MCGYSKMMVSNSLAEFHLWKGKWSPYLTDNQQSTVKPVSQNTEESISEKEEIYHVTSLTFP